MQLQYESSDILCLLNIDQLRVHQRIALDQVQTKESPRYITISNFVAQKECLDVQDGRRLSWSADNQLAKEGPEIIRIIKLTTNYDKNTSLIYHLMILSLASTRLDAHEEALDYTKELAEIMQAAKSNEESFVKKQIIYANVAAMTEQMTNQEKEKIFDETFEML